MKCQALEVVSGGGLGKVSREMSSFTWTLSIHTEESRVQAVRSAWTSKIWKPLTGRRQMKLSKGVLKPPTEISGDWRRGCRQNPGGC